jgi:hypothetical protein
MKAYRIVLLALVAIPLLLTWNRDLIQVNKGFGWDGKMYGMYTQHLPEAFKQEAVNSYRMQRMLVPAVLFFKMDWLGIPRTEKNVVNAYRVSNALFILIGALAFLFLAYRAKWHWITTSLGFAALWLSVPVLKMSMFYPLMPDIPAMAMGMVAIACWYAGWRAGLLAAILLGSFTAPTMFFYGLLLLFPKEPLKETGKVAWWQWTLLPALYLIIWIYVWLNAPDVFSKPPAGSQSVRLGMLPVALLISMIYLGWLGTLIPRLPVNGSFWKKTPWLWAGLLVGVLILVRVIIQWCAGPEAPPQTFTSFGQLILAQSVTYPASFMVAHFQYLPGLVLLGAFSVPFVRTTIRKEGLGPLLLTMAVGLLLLGSETRQLLQLIPWMVFVFCHSVDREWRFTPWVSGLWLAGLLIAGRWWQNIGQVGSLDLDFLKEPAQRYFRFHGPWMNEYTWMTTLGALCAAGLLLAILWRAGFIRRLPENERQNPKP